MHRHTTRTHSSTGTRTLRLAAAASLLGSLLLGMGCQAESVSRSEAMPWDSVDQLSAQLLWQSDQAIDRGDLPMALSSVDRALSRVPRLPDAHYQRGLILSNLGRFEEAKASYLEAARLDPDYDSIWLVLGNTALRLMDYPEALQHYERQAEVQPSAPLYVFIGVTLEALGRNEEAREAFEHAVELDGRDAMAISNLARFEMNAGRPEEAVAHARRAFELEPFNPEHRYTLGVYLVQSDRLEEGIRHLEEVLRIAPGHYGAHHNLGRALMQAGEVERGREHLAEAERLQALYEALPAPPE